MSRPVATAALAATLLLIAVAGWRATQYGLWQDGEPGPGLFPLLACCLTLGATAAVLLELRAGAGAASAAEDDEGSSPTPGRLAATMVIVLAWGLLLQPIGYALASGTALTALMLAGGVRAPAAVAIALAAVGATELLFVRLLEVPLPSPAWF